MFHFLIIPSCLCGVLQTLQVLLPMFLLLNFASFNGPEVSYPHFIDEAREAQRSNVISLVTQLDKAKTLDVELLLSTALNNPLTRTKVFTKK